MLKTCAASTSRSAFASGLLALLLLFAQGARAADDNLFPFPLPFTPGADFREFGHALVDRTGAIEFGVSAAATLAATTLDHPTRDEFARRHRWGALEHVGNDYLGTGVPGTFAGMGLLAYGLIFQDRHEERAGLASLEALVTTYAITFALKYAVERRRPDDSDNFSFPSAHTSTVAASASVLAEMYGWKIGVPAYALVLITAEGRWGANRHWLSDTVAGAAVGTMVGSAFARGHEHLLDMKVAGQTWRLSPYLDGDGGGFLARLDY